MREIETAVHNHQHALGKQESTTWRHFVTSIQGPFKVGMVLLRLPGGVLQDSMHSHLYPMYTLKFVDEVAQL